MLKFVITTEKRGTVLQVKWISFLTFMEIQNFSIYVFIGKESRFKHYALWSFPGGVDLKLNLWREGRKAKNLEELNSDFWLREKYENEWIKAL